MLINKKIALYSALIFAVILALIFLAFPPLIKHLAVKKIDEATGRKSQIAKVSLNPLTLSAGISGFRLSEKGSSVPFLAMSSARLSLSPLSLPKRSFIISELHLESPYVHIVRNAPNNFNFSDLVTGKKKGKGEAGGGTPLFSINNITIKNGNIEFQDKALKTGKHHSVKSLDISVPFFTNMPYLADRYVTPRLSAVVNGSSFIFQGRLKPLTKAVEATIALNVKDLDLPYYLGYLPVPPPVNVVSGKLGTALELGYRVDEKNVPEVRLAGSVALDRVELKEPGGAPLAALDRAELKIRNLYLLSRRMDLSSLEVQGIELHAARDRLGRWNFQKLAEGEPGSPRQPQPAEKKPLALRLAKLSLTGGKLHLSDDMPRGGFRTDLGDINVHLENFSTVQAQRAPFSLELASVRGESAAITGEVVAAPLEVKGSLTLKGIPLKDYYPYLYDTLASPVTGTLSVASDILYSGAGGLVLEKSSLKGEGVAARFGPGEGVSLKEAMVGGIRVNLKQRKAAVERVELKGGSVSLSREKEGGLSAQRLLRAKSDTTASLKQPAPSRKGGKGKQAIAPPFSYRVEKVTGSDLRVKFTDRTLEEEPAFTLSRMNFSLNGISGPKQGAIPFTFATGYDRGGRIVASGSLTPAPLGFRGNVELNRIPLRDFDPYINRNAAIFIAEGALDTKMAVDIRKGADGFKGGFNGSLGVRSFYCLDAVEGEDLLKWERLQLERVQGTVGPFTLAISDVALSNFYSRIIIHKDGTLNLQHLKADAKPQVETVQGSSRGAAAAQATTATQTTQVTQKGEGLQGTQITQTTRTAPSGTVTAQTAAAAAAPTTVAAQPAPQPHPIRIDAVTMQGGTLHFTDRHLESSFDTTFFNLGGRVSGLSSQSNRFADVDLRGNLENHSPLAITGVINPLRGDLYLDLKIAFSDIELTPFTPYSDTYLGYDIDKGKLNLELSYRIDKKTLSSQNKVFIDQFTFGKEVESAKATKLPVRLAVALLKDRKGEIHLDLPVVGRTDDPQFSVWKVVWQMLRNLLVKAATSPFALLGSMFGGDEDFSAVFFQAGSRDLPKAEQDKLMKLSQALTERPAINLDITGYVEKERDAEGYRNESLLKKMKGEKFRTLVKQGKSREGQSQDETEILSQEYSQYLEAVYKNEKFPKPRNALGFAKKLPDAEMKKLILANTQVGNNELQALARERAAAVKAFLMTEGKVPAQRLFEKSADIYKPGGKEGSSGSRVEFGANIK